MLAQLQKDYESLFEQSQQDTCSLQSKENEIERLKRSVNKLQKENVQLRNDMRKGGKNPAPSTIMNTQRKMSSLNTDRQKASPFSQIKKKATMPLQEQLNNGQQVEQAWMSSELDYNINHFNELLIKKLSN